VHSPRFAFTADASRATQEIERLGVTHPVALDLDYAIWRDYGCRGWPSLFLWGRGGALRWAHNGEGEYQATEEAIQEELRGADVTADLPPVMEPLRATDVRGALVPVPTAELLPGGSPAEPWEPKPEGEAFAFEYEAGEAWIVAEGEGELGVAVDDEPGVPLSLPPDGLIQIAGNGEHEPHRVELSVPGGVRIWAVSFAPGAP
jgi:hypothetical protein